jgi:DNA-binding CsgD family transcriptional regulator
LPRREVITVREIEGASAARAVSRLVGRDAEVGMLEAALTRALHGDGSSAVIVGEAGIGKTRLAQAVASAARDRQANVVWGRCYEGDGAPAFWPWLQIVRGLLKQLDNATLAATLTSDASIVAQLVPEVRERLPGLAEPTLLSPDQARFRLFEAINRFLASMADRQAIVLIVDDVHWADQPSFLLLEFLARALHVERIFLVVTCRDIEPGWKHPLTHAMSELTRQHTLRIELRGLGRDALAELVASTSGEAAQPRLVDAIDAATDGNPFFTTELVRLLASEGRLDGSRLGVPATVREVIGRRLSYLSATASQALLVAALLGRDFDASVLVRVLEPGMQLTESIEEALAARLIVEQGRTAGRYSFTHALIRETLYELIGSAPRRARLHERSGEAIEAVYATQLDQHFAELAHHFIQAGAAAKAVHYASRAGEQALRQLAYEEAVAHYERALQARALAAVPNDADARELGSLLLALGDAQAHAGDLQSSARTFRDVVQLARQHRLHEVLARAAIGFGGPTESAVTDQVFNSALLSEALRGLDSTDSGLRATVLSRLAWALMTTGPQARAAEVSEEALAIARRLGDEVTLVNALYGRLAALLGPDRADERLAVGTELGRLGERTGDLLRAVRGHSFRLFALLELGDVEGAKRAHADYQRVGEELRLPMYQHASLLRPAVFELFEGRFAEGERLLREARAGMQRLGYPVISQIYTMAMLMTWADRDPENSRLEVEVARLDDHPFCVRLMASALAWMRAETGRAASAHSLLDDLAVDDFAWLASDGRNWLPSAAFCAVTCALLGDRRRAAVLYEEMRPYAGRNVALHMGMATYGAVSRYLGLLAATLERWSEADLHFEAALALNSRMGARPCVVRTRYDFAVALLDRPNRNDAQRSRAQALLREARAEAEVLGMTRLEQRCQERLPHLPAGLTAREAEVLALLASGCSNKAIAEQLTISGFTVERHITNLYAKIGARGRADATAFALRHDLLGSHQS